MNTYLACPRYSWVGKARENLAYRFIYKKSLTLRTLFFKFKMLWLLPPALSGAVILALSQTPLRHGQASWLWVCFAFVGYANHNIHKIWVGKNEIKFFDLLITAIIVRALVSFACFGGFLWAGVQNIRLFTLYFIFLYLFSLCFEIYNIVANLHPNSKPLE